MLNNILNCRLEFCGGVEKMVFIWNKFLNLEWFYLRFLFKVFLVDLNSFLVSWFEIVIRFFCCMVIVEFFVKILKENILKKLWLVMSVFVLIDFLFFDKSFKEFCYWKKLLIVIVCFIFGNFFVKVVVNGVGVWIVVCVLVGWL